MESHWKLLTFNNGFVCRLISLLEHAHYCSNTQFFYGFLFLLVSTFSELAEATEERKNINKCVWTHYDFDVFVCSLCDDMMMCMRFLIS